MKAVQILRNGNTRTLLTVAADRITIKIKDGLEPSLEPRIQSFLVKVAEQLKDEQFTMRGTLMDDHMKITMKSTYRSETFSEADLQSAD
jgi:hypothetical protein